MDVLIFIQLCINCIIVGVLLGKKVINHLNILIVILSGFFLVALYREIGIFSSLFVFLLIFILSKRVSKKWVDALYYASIAMIIMVLSDHLASFITRTMLGVNSIFTEADTIDMVLMLIHEGIALTSGVIVAFIWRKLMDMLFAKHVDSKNLNYIFAFFSFFTYIIYFSMIVYVRIVGSQSTLVLLNTIYLFIYFVIFVASLFFMVYTFKKRFEMKEKEIELTSMQIYTEQLEQNYTEMRRFRHDYINILASMAEYINKRDVDALENYFNKNIMQVSHEIRKNDFKMRDLTNLQVVELKGLIASKLITAQEKGLNVSFECPEVIEQLNMDRVTLCRCIGILLDNAIEAAGETDTGQVRVGFVTFDHSVSFIVWNDFDDKGYKMFNYYKEGFSTKGEGRGLGLNTLKALVDAAENLHLDTIIENEMFKQEIKIVN
ncbi:sensor histidine kinase [Enterococcus termitis]|nr:GHKL domain-containing protein [Enterococcus termitis]